MLKNIGEALDFSYLLQLLLLDIIRNYLMLDYMLRLRAKADWILILMNSTFREV